MTTRRAQVTAMIAFCVVAATSHAKDPGVACSPGIAGGPDARVTVVIVDRTSWRDTTFNAAVEAAVAASFRPNARLVLWQFGGKTKALPQLVMDVTTEQLPEEQANIAVLAEKIFNKIGHSDKLRECVRKRLDTQRRAFIGALHTELTTFDASSRGFSPIILALTLALQPFTAEAEHGLVRVLLLSDGFEFSSVHATFYADKNGHYPAPRDAVSRTRAVQGSWRGAKITVAGIGVSNSMADVASATALLEIWRAIILDRGAIPAQITTGAPQWAHD